MNGITDRIKSHGLWPYVEYLLWFTGIVCVGLYLSVVTVRQASSQVEIERFLATAKSEHNPDSAPPGRLARLPVLEHDKSLWSQQRIKAYASSADQDIPRIVKGVLSIPSLGLQAPVYEGISDWALNRGLGWIPGTAPIGASGNVGIAGHRDSFFRVLKDISKEDIIEVVGTESTIRYRVTDTWIVEPEAVHVLDDTNQPTLTLVTCYPFYYVGNAPRRFIVRAAIIDNP
jgi:sortase A